MDIKKIFKSKAFWITIIVLVIVVLVILWLRKYLCENGKYPWDSSAVPLIYRGKCSFWTGKPIPEKTTEATSATTRQAGTDCCKDADGRTCYPCVSIACCGAGFRAGYLENRDVIERRKIKT